MKLLNTIFCFLFAYALSAQTDCACCDDLHKQFDFWVGDWTVVDTLGNTVGENQISIIEDQCVVLEQWKGARGGTGTSMNYYDASDSTWNQLWVDNSGGILKLKGRFTSGQMVLRSDLIKGQSGDFYYNQISWYQNEDGTVTQLWETYDNNGNLLQTLFKGIYSRKSSARNLENFNSFSSKVVRVLTFNILHGATTKGDFDLDIIAKVIRDASPDFVALQEVDFKTNRAKQLDLATELGWRVNMAPIFGKAMKFDGGEYGEGVLSSHTFLQSRNIALPYTPGSEPRAALEILTELPSGDTIAFVGTHLDHLKDETDRVAQVKKINEVFSLNKYPTILAGDLNAIPGSTPIDILEDMWTASYDKKKPRPTFPSINPKIKIDYVMFFPKNRWRVRETEVIQDSIASDHCAYLVTLELLEE